MIAYLNEMLAPERIRLTQRGQHEPFELEDRSARGQTRQTAVEAPNPAGLLASFHPRIRGACEQLYLQGHYQPAVLEAFKEIEAAIQAKSGREDLYGRRLIREVFHPDSAQLRVNELRTDLERRAQFGVMDLLAGSMTTIRNPSAHTPNNEADPARILEVLSLASLLRHIVDGAEPVQAGMNARQKQ